MEEIINKIKFKIKTYFIIIFLPKYLPKQPDNINNKNGINKTNKYIII